MKQGYVQIYTGDGKGKTTAAMGVALRAVAAGYRVYIGQFMKQGYTGERKVFEALGMCDDCHNQHTAEDSGIAGRVTYEQYGCGHELAMQDVNEYVAAAMQGFERARHVVASGEYDLVVLDEAIIATAMGYLSESKLLELIQTKPHTTELILTGRGASEHLIQAADLVTEMKPIKHYYDAGVMARKGIEM